MRISIITLVHNTLEHVRTLFESIQHTTSGLGFDKEWIIVDNGSSDNSLKAYLDYIKNYPGIRIVKNDDNLSFSIANNKAVEGANGEWILFLNSDTNPQKGWLDNMMECAERTGADVVGARMYFPHSEIIQHAGIVQRDDGIFTHRFYRAEAKNHPEIMQEADMPVTAACMLIKKNVFEELRFDEGFKWGLEDVDLNLKLMATDKKVMYCPKAFLYHVEHGTDEDINRYFKHNQELLNKKWGF